MNLAYLIVPVIVGVIIGISAFFIQQTNLTGYTISVPTNKTTVNETVENTTCPVSCDDKNPCTVDWCSQTSNYQCSHQPINGTSEGCLGNSTSCATVACTLGKCTETLATNCCGNNICESSENCNSCASDCGVCTSVAIPFSTNQSTQTIAEPQPNQVNTTTGQSDTIPNQTTQASKLHVDIVVGKNPIIRGNDQTITITVTDGNNKIDQAYVSSIVIYASGTQKPFTGTTDSNGIYSYTWKIGGNSKTGTFIVTADASKVDYETSNSSTTFEVVSAS